MADLLSTVNGFFSTVLGNPMYVLLMIGGLALFMLLVVAHRIHKIRSEESCVHKAVSEIFSPITGKVVEVNKALTEKPELVNKDPYGEGWMVVVETAEPAQATALMDAAAYRRHIGD